VTYLSLVWLCAEPEGYHFGAADGLGVAVWRSTAADDHNKGDSDVESVTDSDEAASDVDNLAFGFMTWQPNATLLCQTSENTGHTLQIKLVSAVKHPGSLLTCKMELSTSISARSVLLSG